MIDLPPLPPYLYGKELGENERVWSEASVRSFARLAVNEALEAAAQKFDTEAIKLQVLSNRTMIPDNTGAVMARQCAAALRSIKEPT